MTDNIVFKCYYYKPKEKYNPEKQTKEIQKRDFVSCNASYNYVSYVDTGAENKLPKDYAEYVGNNEKSCGVFNKDGLLFYYVANECLCVQFLKSRKQLASILLFRIFPVERKQVPAMLPLQVALHRNCCKSRIISAHF